MVARVFFASKPVPPSKTVVREALTGHSRSNIAMPRKLQPPEFPSCEVGEHVELGLGAAPFQSVPQPDLKGTEILFKFR